MKICSKILLITFILVTEKKVEIILKNRLPILVLVNNSKSKNLYLNIY